MKNYWFVIVEGNYEGEEFFVQADTYTTAREIVKDNFGDTKVRSCGWVDDETAEQIGLDTY